MIRTTLNIVTITSVFLSVPLGLSNAQASNLPKSVATSQSVASTIFNRVILVVNGIPITQYDLNNRITFLQNQGFHAPNIEKAAQQSLIDQTIEQSEIINKKISVSKEMLADAFNNIAAQNKMTPAQFREQMVNAGIDFQHFIDSLHVQIGWQILIGGYIREKERVSPEVAAAKIKATGDKAPTLTQYRLQSILFFTPQANSANTAAKRLSELNELRKNFSGCQTIDQQTKKYSNVIVQDLGLKFPDDLSESIKKIVLDTPSGTLSTVIPTSNGPEAIAVCKTQSVSNDNITSFVYSMKNLSTVNDEQFAKFSEDYLNQLRKKASILYL